MYVRRWLFGCALAAALSLIVYLAAVKFRPVPASPEVGRGGSFVAANNKVAPSNGTAANDAALASSETVVRVNAAKVLATVNGRQIKLSDLMPLSPMETNEDRTLSLVTYRYLLDRAVNRELILQAANAQGVALDESQIKQLADFRAERRQLGPGLVQQLNADPKQLDFESQDVAAFMLQTELLARTGSSPNVSADEVRAYYDQHAADFADLPADEPARSQTWTAIDFQIRTMLAPAKRAEFQSELVAYMDQVKSAADINLTETP
jgi:hypothetical protein